MCPERLSSARKKSKVLRQISRIEFEATKAGKKTRRTLFGVKEVSNPLFDLHIDLYQ